MLAEIFNFLSLVFIIYDTLGYIALYLNKEAKEETKEDYNRLIQTWIIYLGVKYLGCYTTCATECIFGDLFYIIFSIVRLLIALPITGVAKILIKIIIQDCVPCKLFNDIKSKVASKIECAQQKQETLKEE